MAAIMKTHGTMSESPMESLKATYLIVYVLVMGADWLQGPYLYSCYAMYGYNMRDIGLLFTAGFASSLTLGSLIGALADMMGRKKGCLLFVTLYILSCILIHSSKFGALLLGRVLSGVGTSLLFSVFEAWLVSEHSKRNLPAGVLSEIFALASLWGNGVAAILAGLLGSFLVEIMELKPTSPFIFSGILLSAAGIIIATKWDENHGVSRGRVAIKNSMKQLVLSLRDRKLLILGAVQSTFEGVVYCFVFLWTPALQPAGESIPHGLIFSLLMSGCMVGSFTARRLLQSAGGTEAYLFKTFAIAALAISAPYFISAAGGTAGGPITLGGLLRLCCFCIFEVCVGIFWPSIMKLRSIYIDDGNRATLMNLFRIPLNAAVCILLNNVDKLPLEHMFAVCGFCLTCTAAATKLLGKESQKTAEGLKRL